MNEQENRKTILSEWWSEHMPARSFQILNRNELFNPATAFAVLKQHAPQVPSIYILFAETEDVAAPVYIGKAENPVMRWKQHLDGWAKGIGSYAKWRRGLLDTEGKAVTPVMLLIVPLDAVTRPPINGFPITMGALEYQLISLAEAAYPGRLFNSEGKSR